MATIFLSYTIAEHDFGKKLSLKLKGDGHSILKHSNNIGFADKYKAELNNILGRSEVSIFLISAHSLESSSILNEIQLAYSLSQNNRSEIIPILLENVATPDIIKGIDYFECYDKNVEGIYEKLKTRISITEARIIDATKRNNENIKKIEKQYNTYMTGALNAQKKGKRNNSIIGTIWYVVGFAALLSGIWYGYYVLQHKETIKGWEGIASFFLTNILMVGFLGACSRYSFVLGNSYISESLKSSDRIHAMSFGEFYLSAYGQNANWSELKEVFQHWNIDRSSSFAHLDSALVDPQILSLVSQIISSIASAKNDKK